MKGSPRPTGIRNMSHGQTLPEFLVDLILMHVPQRHLLSLPAEKPTQQHHLPPARGVGYPYLPLSSHFPGARGSLDI